MMSFVDVGRKPPDSDWWLIAIIVLLIILEWKHLI